MEDLTGKKFNRLTVTNFSHKQDKGRKYFWNCLCDCKNTIIVRSDHLKNGHTKSCGCLRPETITKHSLGWSRSYACWFGMKDRCNNPNNKSYHRYGGRGIRVCDEWKDVEVFIRDMGHPPDTDLQIDRIDNDGDYEPSNCRWVTKEQNARNRSNNRRVDINGRVQTVVEWAREYNIKPSLIYYRLYMGWPGDMAVLRPKGDKKLWQLELF